MVQLSFRMRFDDSFCDKRLAPFPNCLADLASPMPLVLLVCLPVCLSVCASACLLVCLWCRFDFEGLENGEEDFLDKSKSWSRSIEDLHRPSSQPFYNTLVRSARQSVLRYVRLR